MINSSKVLSQLIEPSLRALRRGYGELLFPLARQAEVAVAQAANKIRERDRGIDEPSFDLGVATTFSQLLTTAAERSVLSDAVRKLEGLTKGLETLHHIALLNYAENTDATQAAVADRIGEDRGNFNRRIYKLQELGLVETEKRGRQVLCALSALGTDVLSELRPGWRAIDPASQEVISGDDMVRATVAKNWLLRNPATGELSAFFKRSLEVKSGEVRRLDESARVGARIKQTVVIEPLAAQKGSQLPHAFLASAI